MKIIDESLFGHKVINGVVTRNNDLFPEFGFSISNTPKINQDYIKNCRTHFANKLQIDEKNIIKLTQVHSDNIEIINDLSIKSKADSLITNIKGICITVSLADCLGILVYDPINEVIAAIHSGWQGTKLDIVGKTIQKLITDFNSSSEDLLFYLSPSASVDNYEVGPEFLDFFPNSVEIRNNKYYFDNRKTVINQILNKKCKFENITASEIDTISDLEMQSHRRDKENAGRMSAFIMLK